MDALNQAADRLCASGLRPSEDASAATDADALRISAVTARLVRGCCAGCPEAQALLGGTSAPLVRFLTSTQLLVEGGIAWSASVLAAKRMFVQALVNLAAGCSDNAARVWAAAWPTLWWTTLQVGLSERDRPLLGAVTALLHTCIAVHAAELPLAGEHPLAQLVSCVVTRGCRFWLL